MFNDEYFCSFVFQVFIVTVTVVVRNVFVQKTTFFYLLKTQIAYYFVIKKWLVLFEVLIICPKQFLIFKNEKYMNDSVLIQ